MAKEISITQALKGMKQTRPDPKQPQHHCCSCTKCNNKYCEFFSRRVEPLYNRCFYHSQYKPVQAKFITPANLKEIMKQEELLYG